MKEEITLVIPLGFGRKVEYSDEIKSQSINIIEEFGSNTSENRNRGAKKVKTKYIGFINGHTQLDSSWKHKAIEFFEKYPGVDIVGGPQLTPKDEKGFAKISGYAFSSKFGAAKLSLRYSPGKFDFDADEKSITSANLICKREVFNLIKFDETIYPGEDPKFIADAKSAGFHVAYNPEIITYNKRRATVKELAKQIFTYGKVRPAKEKFSETLKKPFFLIPSIFFLYSVWIIMIGFLRSLSLLALIPVLVYAFLALVFALHDSIKNKNLLSFFVLPFIYITIHLSYGAGMLWGYIKGNKHKIKQSQ